jgi:ribosomal-protein-alanine N-acetyltransferase
MMTEITGTYSSTTLPFTLERASLADLGAVHQLEKLCFPLDAWPWIELAAAMSLPGVVRYKAILDSTLVGFVAGERERLKSTAWIATICVHPDYRGRGIGRALLTETEQAMGMPRVRLSVRENNEDAIHMYERSGYDRVGRWPRYYAGGEAAVVMEKLLS